MGGNNRKMKKEYRDKLLLNPTFTRQELNDFLRGGFETVDKYQLANATVMMVREIETNLTYLVIVEE